MTDDLKTRRYRAAWAAVKGRSGLSTDLEGLPMSIRSQGLAACVAGLHRRGDKGAAVADMLAAWVLAECPVSLLGPDPTRASGGRSSPLDRSRQPAPTGRDLLRALLESEDSVAVAALTDEAIEYAAALKRLAP